MAGVWLFGAVAPAAASVEGYYPRSGYQLVYQDEFNGNSLNTNDWYYRDSLSPRLGGYNQKKNVSVTTEDGIGLLKIDYTKEDLFNTGTNVPVGGGVISRTTFGYGYYEARIKFYDEVRGFHQSFWNYGYRDREDAKNDRVPWSNKAIELDGIELDSDFNTAWVNFHWHIDGQNQTSVGDKEERRVDSYIDTDQWVVIGFEWLPDAVVYYVDGIERYRYDYTAGDPRYTPSEIWLTGLGNTADFLGGEGFPEPGAAMRVDYFRFYTKIFDANYTGNRGMESQAETPETVSSWIADDGIYNNVGSDQVDLVHGDGSAYAGETYMRHVGKTTAGSMTSRMRLDHIANGTYTFSAWAKHSGGMNECRMHVESHGGGEISRNIPLLTNWTRIKIENIEVTSHEIDLGFTTQGPDGEWLHLDEVRFEPRESAIEVDPENVLDNGTAGYTEGGTGWANSGLKGYDNSSTRYSQDAGAYAQWNPDLPEAGTYDVYFYKVVHSASTTDALLDTSFAGGTEQQTLDLSAGESGWIFLGAYPFSAGDAGFVRITGQGGVVRADAIMTVPSGELVIDDVSFDRMNVMIHAKGLNRHKRYVLKSSNNLTNGFTRIEDGPRSPVSFSNPGSDVFFAPRPEGFEDRMFYRIEGE